MDLLSLFGTRDADAAAREIGAEFTRHCPPAAATATDRESVRRLAKASETLVNRTANYVREHRLGWLRRAHLLRRIQGRLREAGHDDAVVDEVLYAAALKCR
jgi:hypothetical protein